MSTISPAVGRGRRLAAPRRGPFRRLVLAAFLLAGGLVGCARNPATGDLQLSLIGREREIEIGRQADEDIVRSMGVYEAPELAGRVEAVGTGMATSTERPDLPWTFRVVDEPVVNAFALPGGFVYMTRGILARFQNEAQLAAVLGHEIGHVTARHSVNRMSRARLANLGVGLGTVLAPEIARFQGLISTGLQLAFLKFSRDDERESDDLGLRYMVEAGFDPREMPEVFAMLARTSEGSGGQRVPGWLSTHPDPEDRRDRIREKIRGLTAEPDALAVNRDAYLRLLDGIVWGVDPRNGYFRDIAFFHPRMEFRMDFPEGWRTENQRTAVVGQAPEQDALVVLTVAEGESARLALQEFFDQQGVSAGATDADPVNGLEAAWGEFRARTEGGETLAGLVVFVEHGGRVFRILGYTAEGRFGRYEDAFRASLGSFRRLTDRRALSVEPKRIEIVELPEAMTLTEFHRRWPSTIPLEEVARLNQADARETLARGRLVKRVVGEGAPDGG